jgi:hypothetical protein
MKKGVGEVMFGSRTQTASQNTGVANNVLRM